MKAVCKVFCKNGILTLIKNKNSEAQKLPNLSKSHILLGVQSQCTCQSILCYERKHKMKENVPFVYRFANNQI